MKKVQRLTRHQITGAIRAIDIVVNDLNCNELTDDYQAEVPQRWIVADDYKFTQGSATIIDTLDNTQHAVFVYTDGNDFYAYVYMCYDGWDGEWMGQSMNGQAFTIVNELPVVLDF